MMTDVITPPHASSFLHHTPPHSTILHHTPPLSTTLHHTPPHSTTLHHTPPHSTTLHHTPPHSTTLHHTPPQKSGSLNKAVRVNAWISRFVYNCRAKATKKETRSGPLTTQEINDQHSAYVKQAQAILDDKVSDDKQRLGVQMNEDGILVCKARLQGQSPMFLPDSHLYTTKLVEDAHQRTLHGGVGLTMAKIRENVWVPRLRQLVKKTVKGCHGCRRFHA